MSEKEKPKEQPKDSTSDLRKKLEEISFKNSQIKHIMSENASLKQQLGNRGKSSNRKQASGGSFVSGLAKLGSTLDVPVGYSKKGR
jgi:hypothetical protein